MKVLLILLLITIASCDFLRRKTKTSSETELKASTKSKTNSQSKLDSSYNVRVLLDGGSDLAEGKYTSSDITSPSNYKQKGLFIRTTSTSGKLSKIVLKSNSWMNIPYHMLSNFNWSSGCWNCRRYHASTVTYRGNTYSLKLNYDWNSISDDSQRSIQYYLNVNIYNIKNKITMAKYRMELYTNNYIDNINASAAAAQGKSAIEAEIANLNKEIAILVTDLSSIATEQASNLKAIDSQQIVVSNLRQKGSDFVATTNEKNAARQTKDATVLKLKKSLTDATAEKKNFDTEAALNSKDFKTANADLKKAAVGDNASTHVDAALAGFIGKNKVTVESNLVKILP